MLVPGRRRGAAPLRCRRRGSGGARGDRHRPRPRRARRQVPRVVRPRGREWMARGGVRPAGPWRDAGSAGGLRVRRSRRRPGPVRRGDPGPLPRAADLRGGAQPGRAGRPVVGGRRRRLARDRRAGRHQPAAGARPAAVRLVPLGGAGAGAGSAVDPASAGHRSGSADPRSRPTGRDRGGCADPPGDDAAGDGLHRRGDGGAGAAVANPGRAPPRPGRGGRPGRRRRRGARVGAPARR